MEPPHMKTYTVVFIVVINQQTVHWGSLSPRAELRLLQLGSWWRYEEHHQNAWEEMLI